MWFINKQKLQTVAAVDLGSNSFHMIVANVENGQLNIIDRLVEPVRLAAGLDKKHRISGKAAERAISCLEKFGQRLRNLPPQAVRAVGTNTLRRAASDMDFIEQAETALGHSIEIISGIEEARLVYLGVSHSVPNDGVRRLVIDIGGGSTELVIGEGFQPIHAESLYLGCVSSTLEHFPDGVLTQKRFKQAILDASREFSAIAKSFRNVGWDEVVGSSGTIRSTAKIIELSGLGNSGINKQALKKLIDEMVDCGHIDQLSMSGLSQKRAEVLPGGVAIIYSALDNLKIKSMRASESALREGLLYDLIGRIQHEDIREQTIAALMNRYSIDTEQASRVEKTIDTLLEQLPDGWLPDDEFIYYMLKWAAEVHELGLAIAHNHYHRHGAYVLKHADLAGFSSQEQLMLSTLVRAHRRKFPLDEFTAVPKQWRKALVKMAILLRLAVLLNRARSDTPLPALELSISDTELILRLPQPWLDDHPLTQADFTQEARYLKNSGFSLVTGPTLKSRAS